MLNEETIIHPVLHHVGVMTSDIGRLADWYAKALGMRLVYRSDNPTGAKHDELRPKAAWLSNDAANHRIAVVELPDLQFDDARRRHSRIQHIAFAYRSLDELLGTYLRLRHQGIRPVLAADEGAQTAFYYEDPDRNSIELNVSNYPEPPVENWTSIEHMQTSGDFARRPLGVDVDPDRLVAARLSGASHWELHKRAWKKEFTPTRPYDPMVLL
jgi:catechol 2,3-dioxygenase